ncbi:MAG: GNAT family N-acetyltransferase [Acidobacteriota bacterium]|nr:GNAT family N-acetyltransferase [Acidobacteriota bacterium]
METAFQKATRADVEELLPLMRGLYEHDRLPFDEAATRVALERLLEDERLGGVWLIKSGASAVGYIVLAFGYSLEFRGRDAFLDELYLRPEARGRGTGRKALEFVEGVCRSQGVRALHLEVERANTGAQALYRKSGFVDHDRYLMTKWVESKDEGKR